MLKAKSVDCVRMHSYDNASNAGSRIIVIVVFF